MAEEKNTEKVEETKTEEKIEGNTEQKPESDKVERSSLENLRVLENIDVNNLDKLAKTFCFYGTYEGFNKVKIIDPIEYMETGNLNAHIEIECW